MRIRRVISVLRVALMAAGLLSIATFALAFTNVPWAWYAWLAYPGQYDAATPAYIVVMGGGGIPSESGLMRTWKAAEAASLFPDARVVVAIPGDDDQGIGHELEIRGVDPARLLREPDGRNTGEQAVRVFAMLEDRGGENACIALVTSPEHMRRTWLSFRNAGFKKLVAIPAWAEAIEADLDYSGDTGQPVSIVRNAVGGSMAVRYRFWDNLAIMSRCAREVVALAYYRVAGWI